MTIIVPPIKCQGIKTKIVPLIRKSIHFPVKGKWIEPFCGSCVVALNVQPERALLADTNKHIIDLYKKIQEGLINHVNVRIFLESEAKKLSSGGEKYYYEVRERFNQTGDSFDFLFLNRSCFNGVMRFNRHGKFNVPFGHKPDRFRQAYITKITNQIKAFADIVCNKDWRFEVLDFRNSLNQAENNDIIYADPPYAGRHVDYYNSWGEQDEEQLINILKNTPSQFLLSTWHSNKYRQNTDINEHWQGTSYFMKTIEHFYHVGATEDLRNSMIEALISNYKMPEYNGEADALPQQEAMF